MVRKKRRELFKGVDLSAAVVGGEGTEVDRGKSNRRKREEEEEREEKEDKRTITGVEKKLRRREAKKAGGGGNEQSAAVAKAEDKARHIPGFRPFTAGENIAGNGIDPTTDRTGVIAKGDVRSQLEARGIDTSQIPGTGEEFQRAFAEILAEEQPILQQSEQPQEEEGLTRLQQAEQEGTLTRTQERQRQGPLRKLIQEQFGDQGVENTETFLKTAAELGLLAVPSGLAVKGIRAGAGLIRGSRAGASLRVSPVQKIFARERSIANIQRKFRVGGRPLPRKAAEEIATEYEKLNKTGLSKLLDPIKNASTLKKATIVGGIGTFSTAQGITQWYAVDNILGGTGIFLRDVVNDVQFGNMSYEDGVQLFEEAEADINLAANFARVGALINPTLWPIAFFYFAGVRRQLAIIDGHRQRLENERNNQIV